MTDLRRVWVDTSAWIAMVSQDDQYHGEAVAFETSVPRNCSRLTSWGIIAETYSWLRYHAGYHIAQRWLGEAETSDAQGFLDILFPVATMQDGIHLTLRRFSDQALSYVDALTLHVVQTRGDIDAIFGFDHHLALAGVPVLPGRLR